MTTILAILAISLLALAVFFCTVELCVLLAHRLRLRVLAESGDARARLLNRLLEHPDLAATSANVGMQLSIAGLATVSWLIGVEAGFSIAARVAVSSATIVSLLLLVTLLPRAVVPARPTRLFLVLAYPFDFFCWLFLPLSRLLLALRGRSGRARGDTGALATHSSLVLREDLRRLITRPDLGILPERETEMARKLFRFGGKLVRDLMTPFEQITALPIDATVGDLKRVVAKAGYTRIPVWRERPERLVGLVNIHDALHLPAEHALEPLLRAAPCVPPNSLAQSLFIYLQRNPDWMAFVERDGRCEGIVTVEDLVEEILGEIYDEFELPRPRYVSAGRRRLRVSGTLTLRELARDLRRPHDGLDDTPLAQAVRERLTREPREGERLEIAGIALRVTRVVGGEVTEIEISRRA